MNFPVFQANSELHKRKSAVPVVSA